MEAALWESVEAVGSLWQPPQGIPADHLVVGLGALRRTDSQEGEMPILEEE